MWQNVKNTWMLYNKYNTKMGPNRSKVAEKVQLVSEF